MSLKGIAKATLTILERGHYTAPSGQVREIEEALAHAKSRTVLYRPDHLPLTLPAPRSPGHVPRIEVREGTTQAIARELVQDEGVDDLVLLCFASARNVCGGFLNGARSQEEDLARSSGLYACLRTQPDYYTINRAQHSLLYTDHLIYSPRVPFFRERNRQLLEHPFLASVITAPAPNTGQYLRQAAGDSQDVLEMLEQDVIDTLTRRARHVLEIACAQGHRNLLLGAWGCGVFCNDPRDVARAFEQGLDDPAFAGAFDRVVFGVYDRSPRQDTLCVFKDHFARQATR